MNKKLLFTSLLLSVVLVACKSTPMTESKPAPASNSKNLASQQQPPARAERRLDIKPAPSAPKEVMTDNALDTGDNMNNMDSLSKDKAVNALKDPNNILSKRSIFFDFDSDAIKAEFRPLIEAHAKYLLANPTAKIALQGNTDAHGTREYNLALGQRRSVAVKNALNLLGVADKQIETVSFGEEKANQNCQDDACFAANRHADIVYDGE